MRTSIPTVATVATLGALTLGLAGSAHAAGTQRTDPSDLRHGSDLLSVRVANKVDDLVVVTTHRDLRRDPSSGSGGSVFIDTDPADAGPEYVVVGGWFEGTDYALLETEGWATSQWREPVEGSYELRIDYDTDKVRVRVSQDAIGAPDAVRVAVRAAGPNTRIDWIGAARSFTPWVARG